MLEKQQGQETPLLFLHSCCAPCSSYVLEYLAPHFRILDFFYNPNISPEKEYRKRAEELQRLIRDMGLEDRVTYLEGKYDPERFFAAARGLEQLPEGGERCTACFRLRLEETARAAAAHGADYVTTTLTISPLKDAVRLNTIGEQVCETYGLTWLPSDFKKKNGYKRSVELSAQYDLYRQDFCGCVFSARERERQKAASQETRERGL